MDIKYFDNAATTQISKEVFKEMLPYLQEEYGNPSSIYTIGRKSRKAIEDAREKVAKLINCKPEEIIFTSCGSESDNTAIKGIAYQFRNNGNHIITSKIEHPAVLNTCKILEKKGFKITYLDVDNQGFVKLEELEKAITKQTTLISIMFANNEIGTIQPIEEIAKIAKKHNIIFHTDAVQAAGNIEINVEKLGIDMLSISGHKIHAPKGIGALYVKNGIKFEKFIEGGHQEKNRRAGTENVAGIVGLGKACEIAKENLNKHREHLLKLRDYYISEVEKKIEYVELNGSQQKRLPGNANFSFKFIEGESLLLNLDMKGICASSGSACTSGSLDPSHVLCAIGVKNEVANSSLRVSFGDENTKEDVDFLIQNLIDIVKRLRNMSPLYEEFLKQKNK